MRPTFAFINGTPLNALPVPTRTRSAIQIAANVAGITADLIVVTAAVSIAGSAMTATAMTVARAAVTGSVHFTQQREHIRIRHRTQFLFQDLIAEFRRLRESIRQTKNHGREHKKKPHMKTPRENVDRSCGKSIVEANHAPTISVS
jgi:hypothetical protein